MYFTGKNEWVKIMKQKESFMMEIFTRSRAMQLYEVSSYPKPYLGIQSTITGKLSIVSKR